MKFTRVVLENVFAYDGEVEFDLSKTQPGRNIVLIWGRNGMGKTSFLNSVKLLFTGANDSETRKVGFPPSKLSFQQYILGDGARWTGIINRAARRRNVNLNQPVDARIEISWENQNESYTAKRWWTVHGDEVTEGVHVDRKGERLAAAAAQDFLEETLPSAFIKFFFFDGEEIKTIAESSGSLQSDFDRLLQITFVDDLAIELENLAKERRQRGLESQLRDRLDSAKNELNKATTAELKAREKLAEYSDQLDADSIELRRLQLRRTNLSSGASEAQREALETQREKLSAQLEQVTEAIVNQLPADIPVLANMRLLKQASSQVEARLAAGGSAEANFVRVVTAQLPEWVGEASPDLASKQVELISSHLSDRLHQSVAVVTTSGLFAKADLVAMERVRQALEYWSVAGIERRESQARLLLDAHRIKSDLQEVGEALLHIEVGAQGNVEEFRKVANRIAELDQAVAYQNQQKGIWTNKIAEEKAKQIASAAEIAQLEANQDQASQGAKDNRVLMQIAKALNEIGEALRGATRSELEEKLNDRFRRIISHPLIFRIQVDDTYTLSYFDKSEKLIGRTSLSSGMKQLVATALLWAMKDSAGSEMPVIIDTPLGRIDRENQDHLLRAYYPSLSHQVIILPTNAEIDSRKRAILEPHVASHYRIVNESGDAARVEADALVELP
ncbi:DNA sulfur modification protein DndD [Mesorhizobium sp. RIZ17]|uniref:DNA sulfur modification protein DndD n=1 Tax=Mesorhizobium sp. RIZ17 TaxID=3132743 RepID=UPI003DA88E05